MRTDRFNLDHFAENSKTKIEALGVKIEIDYSGICSEEAFSVTLKFLEAIEYYLEKRGINKH